MKLELHPNKKFSYIPAISAYSSGVVPSLGYCLVGLRFNEGGFKSQVQKVQRDAA